MRNRQRILSLRWLSIIFILFAIVLGAIQIVSYSRVRSNFPSGMKIADIPVGGLDRQQAAERILEIYTLPVEIIIGDARIHLQPSLIGFDLNLESMIAAADFIRTRESFWSGLTNYLMGQEADSGDIPLDASYREDMLRTYLTSELKSRYDQPPTAPQPIPGTVDYLPGSPGTELDINSAVLQIENAVYSSSDRTVNLSLDRSDPTRASFQNLEILLKQTLELEEYDGTASIYLIDMQSGQELHFIYHQGSYLSESPDAAFTAASVIKIPILVSIYSRISNPNPAGEEINLMTEMIEESGNDPADWLMELVIDENLGPLGVTDDMRKLGLENTFLAGLFRIGAPLLQNIETPANQREDVDTDPDRYNQTTTTDIGMLLTDLYQCAYKGGGNLMAIYPGEITQDECAAMIDLLKRNYTPFLIEAGIPDETQIAHKHGWVADNNGVINVIGDAGIVFSPSGDYVLVIYFSHPVQLVWDPISTLISELSRAVYNYYNIPLQ